MKRSLCRPIVQPHPWERSFLWEGLPVLTVQLALPQLEGEGRGCRRINRYYRHVEKVIDAWAARCHRRLCRQAQAALERCQPLPHREIRAAYQVTYQDDSCLSLLWTLETDGVPAVFGNVWALPGGTPLDVSSRLSPAQRRTVGARPLVYTAEGLCVLRDGTPMPLEVPDT